MSYAATEEYSSVGCGMYMDHGECVGVDEDYDELPGYFLYFLCPAVSLCMVPSVPILMEWTTLLASGYLATYTSDCILK